MSEYKRLTSGNFDGQCEYYDYYIDGCRIGYFILKCQECPHKERYDRLKEFEDKKESGQLVELPCIAYNVKECRYQIISTKNGRIYASKLYRDRKEAEARLKELQEGKK